MTDEELERRRVILETMAIPGCFRILALLAKSEDALTTSKLMSLTGVSKATLWYSLSRLQKAGVIKSDRAGGGIGAGSGRANELQHYLPDNVFVQITFEALFVLDNEQIVDRLMSGVTV